MFNNIKTLSRNIIPPAFMYSIKIIIYFSLCLNLLRLVICVVIMCEVLYYHRFVVTITDAHSSFYLVDF